MKAGGAALQRGDYPGADSLYQQALKEAGAFGAADPRLGATLANLAALYYAQGRYAEAEPLFPGERPQFTRKHSVQGTRISRPCSPTWRVTRPWAATARPSRSPDARWRYAKRRTAPITPRSRARSSSWRGWSSTKGRDAEAEALYLRAIAINEKTRGPEYPGQANLLGGLADVYRAQAHYGEAESLYRRALAIWEKTLGPWHPNVAGMSGELAALYREQGRYGEAESLQRRALAIGEKVFGPESPHVASALNNLASVYRVQARYDEAEPLYRRALAIREKALGPEHAAVAESLSSLAVLHESRGRYGDAQQLHRRVLAISEKALGPEHPDVATALNNLAGSSPVAGPLRRGGNALSARALYLRKRARAGASAWRDRAQQPGDGRRIRARFSRGRVVLPARARDLGKGVPVPSIRTSRRLSTTWRGRTRRRAATLRRSRSTGAPWQYAKSARTRSSRGRHLAQQPRDALPGAGALRRDHGAQPARARDPGKSPGARASQRCARSR